MSNLTIEHSYLQVLTICHVWPTSSKLYENVITIMWFHLCCPTCFYKSLQGHSPARWNPHYATACWRASVCCCLLLALKQGYARACARNRRSLAHACTTNKQVQIRLKPGARAHTRCVYGGWHYMTRALVRPGSCCGILKVTITCEIDAQFQMRWGRNARPCKCCHPPEPQPQPPVGQPREENRRCANDVSHISVDGCVCVCVFWHSRNDSIRLYK